MTKVELTYSDVPMTCEVEYFPGEKAIYFPTDAAHPGTPAEAVLIRALAGGVDVMPLLNEASMVAIEAKAAEMLEAA